MLRSKLPICLVLTLLMFTLTAPGMLVSAVNSNTNGKTYTSTTSGENALLVVSGTTTVTDPEIIKTGNSDNTEADFTGVNAAVLATSGTLNITGGAITANGIRAHGIFAYDKGTVNINETSINIAGNNSSSLVVADGGTITADAITIFSAGDSSTPIRSSRGGGTITVKNSDIVALDNDMILATSPAEINLENNKFADSVESPEEDKPIIQDTETPNTSTDNSSTNVANTTTETANTTGSTTTDATSTPQPVTKPNFLQVYSTILDQAAIENAEATAEAVENSTLNTEVTLNLNNQTIQGDILVDEFSTLNINATSGSIIISGINNADTAESVSLNLSSDSVLSLTADTYLTSLTNEDTENNNIYGNGSYYLYVNGEPVSINRNTYVLNTDPTEEPNPTESPATEETRSTSNNYIIYIILAILLIVIFAGAIAVVIVIRRNNQPPKAPGGIPDMSNPASPGNF